MGVQQIGNPGPAPRSISLEEEEDIVGQEGDKQITNHQLRINQAITQQERLVLFWTLL